MANRNPIAIAAIGIFLFCGLFVALGVAATLLLMLYTMLGLVLGIFGIVLPKLI